MKNKLSLFLICLSMLASSPLMAAWIYEENVDGMTDKNTSYALTMNPGTREGIVVRCDGAFSYDVFVTVGEYIGDGGGAVTYRIDDEDPVDAGNWSQSTDNTAVFAPAQDRLEFLQDLESGGEILFQVRDYEGSEHRMSLSLAGASDAIDKLACR